MALIKCPECGKAISSYALSCPNCGISKNDMKMLSLRTMEDDDAIKELISLYANQQTDFTELLGIIITQIDSDIPNHPLAQNIRNLYIDNSQICTLTYKLLEAREWYTVNLSWALFYIHCFCGLGISRNEHIANQISKKLTDGELGKRSGFLPVDILNVLSQWNYPAKYLLAIEQIAEAAGYMADDTFAPDEEDVVWIDLKEETIGLLKDAMDHGVIEAEIRYAILYDTYVDTLQESFDSAFEQMCIVKVKDAKTGKDTYVDTTVFREIFGHEYPVPEELKMEVSEAHKSLEEGKAVLDRICKHLIELGYDNFVKEKIINYSGTSNQSSD